MYLVYMYSCIYTVLVSSGCAYHAATLSDFIILFLNETVECND